MDYCSHHFNMEVESQKHMELRFLLGRLFSWKYQHTGVNDHYIMKQNFQFSVIFLCVFSCQQYQGLPDFFCDVAFANANVFFPPTLGRAYVTGCVCLFVYF